MLVNIVDDEGWEPDEDFYVILYDPNDADKKQLYGDNTRTKVTILDDDKPGTFQMKLNHVQCKRSDGVARVFVSRVEGSDGDAHVTIESSEIRNCPNPAIDGQDYDSFKKEIHFGPGVSEKAFEIPIRKLQNEDEEEEEGRIFMCILSNP